MRRTTPPRAPRASRLLVAPSPSPPPGAAAAPLQSHRVCVSNVNRPGMLGALTAACAAAGFNIIATHCWTQDMQDIQPIQPDIQPGAILTLTILDVFAVDHRVDTLVQLDALRDRVLAIDGFSSVTLGSFSYSIPLTPTFASARLCIVNQNVPGALARISTIIGAMQLNICSLRNRSHSADIASTIIDLDCNAVMLASACDRVSEADVVISSDIRQFKAESLLRLRTFQGSPRQSYYRRGGGGGVAIERTEALAVMSDRLSRTMDATRQVIVMVGLPARGKSFIARKLAAFLNWGTPIRSRVFNAGKYRRKVQEDLSSASDAGASASEADATNADGKTTQNKMKTPSLSNLSAVATTAAAANGSATLGHRRSREANSSFGASGGGAASFFDASNSSALEQREAAADACMDDMLSFLFEDSSSSTCAIFDATNSTRHRRHKIVDRFASHTVRVIFVEILCTDERVLEENILNKVQGSIDYIGMPLESALLDFRKRVANYASVYEPIDEVLDANLSFITLANMGNRCVLNKVFGTITTVVVPFLIALHVALRPIWFFTVDEETAKKMDLAGSVSGWVRTAIWMRTNERLGLEQSESLSLSESRDEMDNMGDGDEIKKVPIFTPASQALRDAGIAVRNIVDASQEEMFKVVHKVRPALDAREDADGVDLSARLSPLVIELEQQTGPALVMAGPRCTKALLAYFLRSESLLERELPAAGSAIIELIPEQGGNWKEIQHDLE